MSSREKERAVVDDSPRPYKRQRTIITEPGRNPTPSLAPLPPAHLLASLPSLLIHPPNHPNHVLSLCLSLLALKKCLKQPNLTADLECRAYTGIVEIGIMVILSGFSQNAKHPWAEGIEIEVEMAITKGLLLAQKHPSLCLYRPHLTLLSARLAQWQHNTKYARNLLRKLIASFLPTDPPHVVYSAHIALIDHLMSSAPLTATTPSPSPSKSSPRKFQHSPIKRNTSPSVSSSPIEIHGALQAIQTLLDLSTRNNHPLVTLYARVLYLRVLVSAGMWNNVAEALLTTESALNVPPPVTNTIIDALHTSSSEGSTTEPIPTPNHPATSTDPQNPNRSPSAPQIVMKPFDDTFRNVMCIHVLIIGVLFHTYVGDVKASSARLACLHSLMDTYGNKKEECMIVEIPFTNGQPLRIQTTHPRILYTLAFLVSSTTKRDPIGRKPKRKVFASEGLVTWEREIRREIKLSPWATIVDVHDIEQRMVRIKADMLSELVGVSVLRSEFEAAEHNLSLLIAHTRTYSIFPSYAPLITLHHAHLAHALGQRERAMKCYRVAHRLAKDQLVQGLGLDGAECEFVRIAAMAGEVGLRIGRREEDSGEDVETMAMDVAKAAQGMGGCLEAIGQVIESCLSKEILKSKQHLKCALNLATKAQDNHLRALLLALISLHYLHVSTDHAKTMLMTCDQLAAGLGAPANKYVTTTRVESDAQSLGPHVQVGEVGNAPLRLWVGKRCLELYKRLDNEELVEKQSRLNVQLAKAVAQLAAHGSPLSTE